MPKSKRKYGEAWKDVGVDSNAFDQVFDKLISSPSPDNTKTLAQQTTVAPLATLAPSATVARQDTEPLHRATVAPQTTVAPRAIVDTEYTPVPNDLWDEVMPTLNIYDQAVLWQLYRLARGFRSDTCTIGLDKLARRCNIGKRQVSTSVDRLEKLSLIRKLGADFGNPDRSQRGNSYQVLLPAARVAQSATVAQIARVAQQTTVAQGANNKLNTQKKNTQTQTGVGVSSRFSLEECRAYADHLKKTGQGITNPGGFASKIHKTGEADELIELWLTTRSSLALDISKCPDCRGSGFIYIDPANADRGVKKCGHERLGRA